MATKINATQISQGANTSSWYPTLRAIQARIPKTPHGSTKLTQTTDPKINAGTKVTADQVNAFITALTDSQIVNNEFLKRASWSSNKPAKVTQYTKISEANTYTKINTLLKEMQSINANYDYDGDDATNSTNSTCTEYGTNGNCDPNCSYDNTDGIDTTDATYNKGSECEYNGDNGTYGNDGTGDSTCDYNSDDSVNCDDGNCNYDGTNVVEGDYSTDGRCEECSEESDHGANDYDGDEPCEAMLANAYDANDSDNCNEPDYGLCNADGQQTTCDVFGEDGVNSAEVNNGNEGTYGADSADSDDSANGNDGTVYDSQEGDGYCADKDTCSQLGACGDDSDYGEEEDVTCANNVTNETCGQDGTYVVGPN